MSWQLVKSATKAKIKFFGLSFVGPEDDVTAFPTGPVNRGWVGFAGSPESNSSRPAFPSSNYFEAGNHLTLVRPIVHAVGCANHRTPGDEHCIGDISDDQTDPEKQPQFEFSHLRAPWLGHGAYSHFTASVKLHRSRK